MCCYRAYCCGTTTVFVPPPHTLHTESRLRKICLVVYYQQAKIFPSTSSHSIMQRAPAMHGRWWRAGGRGAVVAAWGGRRAVARWWWGAGGGCGAPCTTWLLAPAAPAAARRARCCWAVVAAARALSYDRGYHRAGGGAQSARSPRPWYSMLVWCVVGAWLYGASDDRMRIISA